MEPVKRTLRLEPSLSEGLELIRKQRGVTVNKLMNEAIRQYVDREVAEIDRELDQSLVELRAYRSRDPDFADSIDRVAEAEALCRDDPAEGEIGVREGHLLTQKLSGILGD